MILLERLSDAILEAERYAMITVFSFIKASVVGTYLNLI